MSSIVLSPDPKMQAKRKSIQQELKRQQVQFWKFINEANDWMQDKTTNCYMHGYQRRQAVHLYLYYAGNWNKQTQTEFYMK
jgi:hypothetical protein